MQDPYIFVQVGSQRYRSRTCKDGGKRPVWNERFEFTSTDNTLKITVMDQDTFKDDLVGEGTFNLSKYRTPLPEQDCK
jgi:Ca2+-dependent lipid-binding protein